MANKHEIIANLLRKAEQKFGFRYAVELHDALKNGKPGHREMLRKVLAN